VYLRGAVDDEDADDEEAEEGEGERMGEVSKSSAHETVSSSSASVVADLGAGVDVEDEGVAGLGDEGRDEPFSRFSLRGLVCAEVGVAAGLIVRLAVVEHEEEEEAEAETRGEGVGANGIDAGREAPRLVSAFLISFFSPSTHSCSSKSLCLFSSYSSICLIQSV
jgi:hypothetical protein